MTKGLVQLFSALLSVLAAVYCFLWILSSASLAPAQCYGDFALFHTEIRCRQPYIAMILCAVSVGVAVMLTISGYKNIKDDKGSKGGHGKV